MIIELELVKEMCVKVRLLDKSEYEIDLYEKRNTARFLELNDIDLFYSGKIEDDKMIYWNDFTWITEDEIMNGGVKIG